MRHMWEKFFGREEEKPPRTGQPSLLGRMDCRTCVREVEGVEVMGEALQLYRSGKPYLWSSNPVFLGNIRDRVVDET